MLLIILLSPFDGIVGNHRYNKNYMCRWIFMIIEQIKKGEIYFAKVTYVTAKSINFIFKLIMI